MKRPRSKLTFMRVSLSSVPFTVDSMPSTFYSYFQCLLSTFMISDTRCTSLLGAVKMQGRYFPVIFLRKICFVDFSTLKKDWMVEEAQQSTPKRMKSQCRDSQKKLLDHKTVSQAEGKIILALFPRFLRTSSYKILTFSSIEQHFLQNQLASFKNRDHEFRFLV